MEIKPRIVKKFSLSFVQADMIKIMNFKRMKYINISYSSFELQEHSNLSNIQSFSYNMHNLFLK